MVLDEMEWLGHAGFRLGVGRATVYIDPVHLAGSPPKADLVLITHAHPAHFSPPDLELVRHEGTVVVAPPAVAERARGQVLSVVPGDMVDEELVRGVGIRAVAAYNTSKRDEDGRLVHPREARWLGFDLNVRGERVYHAGDTDVIPEMDEVAGADVALLPVSGVDVMTASEAVEAARRIAPRVAVPMRWGAGVGTELDARAFAERSPVPVRILARA